MDATPSRSSGRVRKQTWKSSAAQPSTASPSASTSASKTTPSKKARLSPGATAPKALASPRIVLKSPKPPTSPTKPGSASRETKTASATMPSKSSPLTRAPLRGKESTPRSKPTSDRHKEDPVAINSLYEKRSKLEVTPSKPSAASSQKRTPTVEHSSPSKSQKRHAASTSTGKPRGRPKKIKTLEAAPLVDEDETLLRAARTLTPEAIESMDIDRPDQTSFAEADLDFTGRQDVMDTDDRTASEVENNALKSSKDALRLLLEDRKNRDRFMRLKQEILQNLTGRRQIPLIGQHDECKKVCRLLDQTIDQGEGNSLLLIGPRGSGKSNLIETAINQMRQDCQNDFHVIRLNGFLQTDDRLAMKEIWRQLGREMEIHDDDGPGRSSYAETMAMLLAVLSQPADPPAVSRSKAGPQQFKAVVFVLNEFDLFTTHPRQTLLYNLFDIAQSSKAPIAVLGSTTRIDIVEALEKRVKSRFSHRTVPLLLPRSFPSFIEICKVALLADSPSQASPDGLTLDSASQSNVSTADTLRIAWSDFIAALLADARVEDMLRALYFASKSIATFFSLVYLPIAQSSPTTLPTVGSLLTGSLLPPASKLDLLPSLSEVEMAMLVAAARLDVILDTDTCNFGLAYDEYLTLAHTARLRTSAAGATALSGTAAGGGRVWGPDIALAAWEHLADLELLVPALGVGSFAATAAVAAGGAEAARGRLWKADVALEEIATAPVDMNHAMRRWCKEI